LGYGPADPEQHFPRRGCGLRYNWLRIRFGSGLPWMAIAVRTPRGSRRQDSVTSLDIGQSAASALVWEIEAFSYLTRGSSPCWMLQRLRLCRRDFYLGSKLRRAFTPLLVVTGSSPHAKTRVPWIDRSDTWRKHVRLKSRSQVSRRSIQATILVMPALVAGIHVF
jgi:hypothetical protein